MWLCVGLGNPGRRYEGTRHNVGFAVIDRLAVIHGIDLVQRPLCSCGDGRINTHDVVLAKPLAYMNRSGLVVRTLVLEHRTSPDRFLIIHDDLDLAPGVLKIRRRGSSGGHRGVESVIQVMGTSEFARVKIGIGRDPVIPAEDYVLRRFNAEERGRIEEAVDRASLAVRTIVTEGLDFAMNTFNRASAPAGKAEDDHDQ